MITGRDTDLAERLRQAAAEGRTSAVIKLLEEGAPFIVDNVSILQNKINFLLKETFPTELLNGPDFPLSQPTPSSTNREDIFH